LAGWLSQWAAENMPGAPNLDSGELTIAFVAGAGVALGAVYKWLDNRGKYELGQELTGQADAEDVVAAKGVGDRI